MLKNIFPKDILDLIYSYDPTFHNKYNKLKLEFYEKTAFWNISNDHLDKYPKSTSKYSLTYIQAKNLEDYWNNDYHIRSISNNPNYNFMSQDQINNIFKTRTKNYTDSLFDFHPNIYKILFAKLKS